MGKTQVILTTTKRLKQFAEGGLLQKQKDWFNQWIEKPGKREYVQNVIDKVFSGSADAEVLLDFLYKNRKTTLFFEKGE